MRNVTKMALKLLSLSGWGLCPPAPEHCHKIFSDYARLWHAEVASVSSARGLNQAVLVQKKELTFDSPLLAKSWLPFW